MDLHPSGCWTSGMEVPRLHKSADTAAGDRLAIAQMLSGRYRIERELGEGGMGVVYLVTDQQVAGETFAVKVLKEVLDPRRCSCCARRCARPASSAIRTSSICIR
jgi:serine/threonine protein kinase